MFNPNAMMGGSGSSSIGSSSGGEQCDETSYS